MSEAEGRGGWSAEPPRAEPPRWFRALPVYAVTLLMVPLSLWMSAMLVALPVAVMVVARIVRGDLGWGDFGLVAQQELNELLAGGIAPLALGVLANSLAFASVALIMVSRRRAREDAERSMSSALAFVRVSPRVIVLAVLGLVGLTTCLDAVIVGFELEGFGRLAEMRTVIAKLTLSERVALSLIVAFGAGISEELFFRGWMFRALAPLQGRTIAIAASSIAFGLFHFDWVHTPVAALMGAYLALVVVFTGSLWPAIAAHVVNNLAAVFLAGAEGTPKDWIVWTGPAGLAVTLFTVWALRYLQERRAHDGGDDPASGIAGAPPS
ncbi:CPBP family intramembrane metalloprotease [Myxococcota bacterium]|nr:CPBP family intramembrane metalloprotease [Myxococcota bacterium]